MNDIRLLPSEILTRRRLDLFRQYYELGLTPIPCEPQSKKPTCEWGWWQHRRPSWEELEAVWRDAFARFGNNLNIATLLGKAHGLCAVDIDNPENFRRARQAIGLTEGDLRTWTLLSHDGGALLFRYPKGYQLPARIKKPLLGCGTAWRQTFAHVAPFHSSRRHALSLAQRARTRPNPPRRHPRTAAFGLRRRPTATEISPDSTKRSQSESYFRRRK